MHRPQTHPRQGDTCGGCWWCGDGVGPQVVLPPLLRASSAGPHAARGRRRAQCCGAAAVSGGGWAAQGRRQHSQPPGQPEWPACSRTAHPLRGWWWVGGEGTCARRNTHAERVRGANPARSTQPLAVVLELNCSSSISRSRTRGVVEENGRGKRHAQSICAASGGARRGGPRRWPWCSHQQPALALPPAPWSPATSAASLSMSRESSPASMRGVAEVSASTGGGGGGGRWGCM